ncbi:MAG: prenyltransferase/squalene oxidase repeat-containing protein [Candidatus Paceibacterota bacterium]|jgi:hypothetical protein
MKKKIFLILLVALTSFAPIARAEETPPLPEEGAATIELTIRSGANIFFQDSVPFPASTGEIDGHTVDPESVLAILNDADLGDDSWNISDLEYFDSFGSFLLNCIQSSGGNDCDYWQYAVNGSTPGQGMDQTTLAEGDSVYVYFSSQNKITLSSDSIDEGDTLTAKAETYDYENDSWLPAEGVTVGITQPNPSGSFDPPIEIMTGETDGNGEFTFSSIPVGTYDVGIGDDYGYYFPTTPLTVKEKSSGSSGSRSSGSGSSSSKKATGEVLGAQTKPLFNVKKAIEFLLAQQQENGVFGEDMYTDWAIIALASQGAESYKMDTLVKLVKYLSTTKPAGENLTDYERHAMALMALGLNPYSTNGENYIQKILSSFDGKQFGNAEEYNDDVFALIVLENAGYTVTEDMVKSSVQFILKAQQADGSWSASPDMTGATIQALAASKEDSQVTEAIAKAKEFLDKTQKIDGGWDGDASSTAWAMGGIMGLGEKPEDWQKDKTSPLDFLATIQDTDGGIKDENLQNRIWKTSYVVSALSGKTWNQIMQKFEKVKIPQAPAPAPEKPKTVIFTKPTPPEPPTAPEALEAPLPPQIENTKPEQSWFGKFFGYIFGF